MNLFVIIALGALVFLLLIGAAVALAMPRKKTAQPHSFAEQLAPVMRFAEPEPLRRSSMREQAVDEDAEVLAEEFRRKKRQKYIAELCSEAGEFFASVPPAKITTSKTS